MDTKPFLSDATLLDVYPGGCPDPLVYEGDEHLRDLRLVADLAVQAYVDWIVATAGLGTDAK